MIKSGTTVKETMNSLRVPSAVRRQLFLRMRVASFKDVTEELIVVQLLAWAGAGKVTISAGQCGHGRWLAVEARHRETTGHKQGEL
jgi:hypothetical protein